MIGKIKNLDEGDLAWLKELYYSYPHPMNHSAMKALGKMFDISGNTIAFHFLRKHRKMQKEATKKWMKNNPERNKEIQLKAVQKYYQTEKGRQKRKKYFKKYWKNLKNNPEKYKKYLEKAKKADSKYYYSSKGQQTRKKYHLKHKIKMKNELQLNKELKQAIHSEGYLIMITRRNNKQLFHTFFTLRFLDDDVPLALKAHEKMLKANIQRRKSSVSGDSNNNVKMMPPEYRTQKVEIKNKIK